MSQIARDLARRDTKALSSHLIEIVPFKSFHLEKFGSLTAAHHFSFGQYYDPKRVRHGLLRVFDDGLLKTTKGIASHPHRNMDIISVVLHQNYHPYTQTIEGGASLVHEDTGGGRDVIPPGSAQVMSIGHSDIWHSENITDEKDGSSASVYQIWINQTRKKQDNSYTKVNVDNQLNKLHILASGYPEDRKSANPAKLQSDSRVFSAILEPGSSINHKLGKERLGYLVPSRGNILLNGVEVPPHDAAKISNVEDLHIEVLGDHVSELVLVDVPKP